MEAAQVGSPFTSAQSCARSASAAISSQDFPATAEATACATIEAPASATSVPCVTTEMRATVSARNSGSSAPTMQPTGAMRSAVRERGLELGRGIAPFAVRKKARLRARAEKIDFEAVHRLHPLDQTVGEDTHGRNGFVVEKRLKDHEGLGGVVRVVARLEVAGDDVVFGTVKESVDRTEALAHLGARPQFSGHAEGVAQNHAGDGAGDAVAEILVRHG